LRDEGFGLVGERIVEADFHGGSCQQSAISSQEPFGMSKETTIVSEGAGKTNSPRWRVVGQFPIIQLTRSRPGPTLLPFTTVV
jgi:hypothetical protein